jgi:hypothetical protein
MMMNEVNLFFADFSSPSFRHGRHEHIQQIAVNFPCLKYLGLCCFNLMKDDLECLNMMNLTKLRCCYPLSKLTSPNCKLERVSCGNIAITAGKIPEAMLRLFNN